MIDTTYKAPKLLKILSSSSFLKNLVNHILENEDLKSNHFTHANFEKFIGTKEFNLKGIYSDIAHTSFRSWLYTFENIAKFDGTRVLKHMKKHVLIVEGAKDSIFDVLIAKKIKNLIKISTLDIIPEANHLIVLNNPRVIEHEVCNFISGLK